MNKLKVFFNISIALLLTGYIYLFEWSNSENRSNFQRTIFTFEPSSVNKVIIKSKTETLELSKSDKTWVITEPLNCKADQTLITTILNNLPKLPRSHSVGKNEQKPLAEYGLQQPLLQITINYINENEVEPIQKTLLFGTASANKEEVYTKLENEDRIYLIPTSVYRALSQNWQGFRNKKILNFNPNDITYFSIIENGVETQAKKILGQWNMELPFSWKLNSKDVQKAIYDFSSLQINRFVQNDLSKKDQYGLDNPSIKLQFTDSQNQITTIFVGHSRAGSTFIQNSEENFIFSVDSDIFLKVLPDLKAFRQLELFNLKLHEIIQLNYSFLDKSIDLSQDIQKIWRYNLTTYPLSQSRVSNFIEEVALITPEYFVDESIKTELLGFNNENTMRIKLKNIQGNEQQLIIGNYVIDGFIVPKRIRFFSSINSAKTFCANNGLTNADIISAKNHLYAKLDHFSQVFVIEQSIAHKLKKPIVYFQPLELPAIPLDSIYTIHRKINTNEEVFKRFGSNINWEQIKPTQQKVNVKKMALFIAIICNFTVEEWIKEPFTEADLPEYELDKPLASIESTFQFAQQEEQEIKTGKYLFVISKKKNEQAHYACLYIAINEEKYKLLPRLFTISEKIVNERLLNSLQ